MAGGFRWVDTIASNPTGRVKKFPVSSSHSTRLAIGDVVAIQNTGDANGVQLVDAAVAGSAVTGVIVGIVPNFSTESFTDTGLAGSTAGEVLVNIDPDALYEVEVSNGPLVIADVGLNLPLVATAATVSGGLTISNMTVNKTGAATTALTEFRLEKLLVGSDGVLGSKCIVKVNNSTYKAGAAGV